MTSPAAAVEVVDLAVVAAAVANPRASFSEPEEVVHQGLRTNSSALLLWQIKDGRIEKDHAY